MRDTSHCREKTQGWLGRRRTYRCRECKAKFQVDALRPVPVKDRICYACKYKYAYVFKDEVTGEETVIKGTPDVELATLRAWQTNPNLTFKGVAQKQALA